MANSAATFNVAQNAADYTVGDNLGTYSGVNLWFSDDSADQLTIEEIENVAAGGTFWNQTDEDGNIIILGYKSNPWSSSGRVLDIVNPFGTVAMASNILHALRQTNGIALNYSPFSADAIIPPHFEIGDAVLVNGDHHGIYGFDTKASRLPRSTINAPADEEIDHEFPFRSDVKSRQLTRKFESIQSQFIVQAGKISAKVSKTGLNNSQTFGWSLTENGFYINNGEVQANGTDLFSFNSSGLHIKGDIEAQTGHIGGTSGFTIQSGKLYSGKSSFNSSTAGVYIGTDGISLGSGFKVTSGGSLTATNGSFGSLSVQNGTSSYSGGLSGCSGSVSNLGGSISSGMAIGGGMTIGNLVSTADQAYTNSAQALRDLGNYMAGSVTANAFRATQVNCSNLFVGGARIYTSGIYAAVPGTYTGTCSVVVNGQTRLGTCQVTISGANYAAANYQY